MINCATRWDKLRDFSGSKAEGGLTYFGTRFEGLIAFLHRVRKR